MLKELLNDYFVGIKLLKFILLFLLFLFILPLETAAYMYHMPKILNNSLDSLKTFAILIICSKIIYIIKEYLRGSVKSDIYFAVRTNIFKFILDRYIKNFENLKYGDIISRFTIIPEKIIEIINDLYENTLPNFMGLLVLMYYIYVKDKNLFKVYFIFLVIAFILLIIHKTKIVNGYCEQYETINHNNNKFVEKIGNLYNIYISNTINFEKNTNEKNEIKLKKLTVRSVKLKTDYLAFINIGKIIIIIILYFKIYNNIKSNNTESNVFILTSLLYFLRFNETLIYSSSYLLTQYGTLQNSSKFINDIIKKLKNGTEKVSIDKIYFNNISFKYPNTDKYILNGLYFTIKPNDKIVIFGKSGSGKSTIFKLVMGFFSPFKGEILVNDQNIDKMDLTYYRNQFAYVGQDTKLLDMSVIDNIKYSITVTNDEVYNLISKYGINPVYEKLENGLNTMAGIDGANLSGGQRQMVLILRALLKRPKIYLFDEPTAALDPNTKGIIYNILKDIKETTIVISHDPKIKEYIPTVYNLVDKKLLIE